MAVVHFSRRATRPRSDTTYWPCRSFASTEHFRAAVEKAKVGPDKDIPHVTLDVIVKYITDLELLGLL